LGQSLYLPFIPKGIFMFSELEEKLGYKFNDSKKLKLALNRTKPDYDRMEFAGDRLLNACIAICLAEMHPDWAPRQLHNRFTTYTCNTLLTGHGGPLYRIAKELEIEKYMTLNPGEDLEENGKRGKQEGKSKEQKLSDHMEALFYAIFLDSGRSFDALSAVIRHLYEPLGLLSEDHASETDFGASEIESYVTEEEPDEEKIQSEFISLAEAGRLDVLLSRGFCVDEVTAEIALKRAIDHRRGNVVPYLIRYYAIPHDVITQELKFDAMLPEGSRMPRPIAGHLYKYILESGTETSESLPARGGYGRGGYARGGYARGRGGYIATYTRGYEPPNSKPYGGAGGAAFPCAWFAASKKEGLRQCRATELDI
jgi:dsRNA-specific ribonuclease